MSSGKAADQIKVYGEAMFLLGEFDGDLESYKAMIAKTDAMFAALAAENEKLAAANTALREAAETVNLWLRAAIQCGQFIWDADQKAAAQESHDALQAALAPRGGE